MKIFTSLNRLWPRGRLLRAVGLATVMGALLAAVISCSSISNQVVALPNVPGQNTFGSSECEQCHEEICRSFKTADHAGLMAEGPNAKDVGCESCHGPCSLHEDSGGDVKTPYSFTPGRPLPAGLGGLTPGMSPARATETVCYQCHADVRGQFELPSHHPVPEGRMDCIRAIRRTRAVRAPAAAPPCLPRKKIVCNAIRPSAVLMCLNTRRCVKDAPPVIPPTAASMPNCSPNATPTYASNATSSRLRTEPSSSVVRITRCACNRAAAGPRGATKPSTARASTRH